MVGCGRTFPHQTARTPQDPELIPTQLLFEAVPRSPLRRARALRPTFGRFTAQLTSIAGQHNFPCRNTSYTPPQAVTRALVDSRVQATRYDCASVPEIPDTHCIHACGPALRSVLRTQAVARLLAWSFDPTAIALLLGCSTVCADSIGRATAGRRGEPFETAERSGWSEHAMEG